MPITGISLQMRSQLTHGEWSRRSNPNARLSHDKSVGRWVRQSWQHISFASDCTAIESRRASDRLWVAILADGPVGVNPTTRPHKAVADRLATMACEEKSSRYARGIGCVLWLTLPWDLGGSPVGNAKASLLLFSEFTIPVAQKASWLLSFGTGVLLSCVAWDISTSGYFFTVQDLFGRPVRTRCCPRS